MTGPLIPLEPPPLAEIVGLFEEAGEAELFSEFFTLSISDLLDRYRVRLAQGPSNLPRARSALGATLGTSLSATTPDGEFAAHTPAFAKGGLGVAGRGVAQRARAERVSTRDTHLSSGCSLRTDASAASSSRRVTSWRRRRSPRTRIRPAPSSISSTPRTCRQTSPPQSSASIAEAQWRVSTLRSMDSQSLVGVGAARPSHAGLTLPGAEVDRFETAWEAQRDRRIPDDFPIEFIVQSVHDDTLAPQGKHILSTGIQQLPFELAEGTWDDQKGAFTDRVLDVMSQYAPRIREHVLETYTITPLDLEREYGLTGGNIFHGAMKLDQIYGARPVTGWGSYRTPISGLYLCGSGAHPGGGVMGVPS